MTAAFIVRPRVMASLFYFLYYVAAGGVLPYLNLFYQETGIPTQQIGILAALMTATGLFAGPLWAGVADRFQLHRWLLPLAILATLFPVLLLGQAASFPALFVLILTLAMCLAPVMPLADNAVLMLLGEQKHEYGKLRLWGAVGWGMGAGITGKLIELYGMQVGFGAYVGGMLLCGLTAFQLPAAKLPLTEPYWRSLRKLAANKRWMGFLASAFLFGIVLGILNNYFVLFVKSLGGGEGLYGLSIGAASVSELPVFFLSGLILRKWSSRGLISLAFVALIGRSFLYATLVDPVWAIAAQCLHGPSFAAMWTAGVSYASEMAPPGLGASVQSLFTATFYGFSGAAGALIGSHLYEPAGPEKLFQIAGIFALCGFVLFITVETLYQARRKTKG